MHRLLRTILGASLLAAPLAAQTPAPAPAKGGDSTDVVVFDHLFQTGILEHEKVFLEKAVAAPSSTIPVCSCRCIPIRG